MTYDKCKELVKSNLKKRGFEDCEEMAADMCNMWAQENGVEREFANIKLDPVRRTFGVSFENSSTLEHNSKKGVDSVTFPVIAITSGLHTYTEDENEQKVYIEPNILKSNIEKFKELPIYLNHQRTPEDLIGMATEPQVLEMEDGKSAVQMMATINNKTGHGQEVMNKVEDGDMTHVSIDWLSNDVDVMGDTYATKLRPTELSFIDNEKMDPVCMECTIGEKCDLHAETKDHDCGCGGKDGACKCEDGKTEVETMTEETNVKSDAENIVEREFASLRTQLEEIQTSKKEIESQYEEALKTIEAFQQAEEKRTVEEAKARKVKAIEAIISKELLFGTTEEETKDTRVEELSAWDEPRLTGFSEALHAMPEPQDTERQFGKGKSNEGDSIPEDTERQFAVKMTEDGTIRLNKELLTRGN